MKLQYWILGYVLIPVATAHALHFFSDFFSDIRDTAERIILFICFVLWPITFTIAGSVCFWRVYENLLFKVKDKIKSTKIKMLANRIRREKLKGNRRAPLPRWF